MNGVLIQEIKEKKHRETQRRRPVEDRGGNGYDESSTQRMPGIDRNQRDKEGSFPQPTEGTVTLLIPRL